MIKKGLIMRQYVEKLWKKPKVVACAAMLLALIVYALGVEWLLPIVLLGVYACFLPMPKIFSSWFSRLTLSILFLYAFLQVAAITQRYTWPGGKFPLIAVLTVCLSALVIGLYGQERPKGIRIFNFKDLAATLSCVLFLLPFAPAFVPHSSLQSISEYSGVQVVDAVTHQNVLRQYVQYQTLAHGYETGKYYPAGFHIAAAFMQYTVFGDFHQVSWTSDVMLYFATYISLSLLLCVTLVYLSLTMLRNLRGSSMSRASILATALTAGMATTVLHLWPFVYLGFLNYIYVCAAALAAACYLVDAPVAFNSRAALSENRKDYGWPLFAFLLLSFGATLSWPLLAPAFLLAIVFVVLPVRFSVIKKEWRKLFLLLWPVGAMILLHLFVVSLQQRYGERDISNLHLILMAGALTNFDAFFLMFGLAVFTVVVIKRASKVQDGMLAVVTPYIILIVGLIALHLLALGEIRYYVIKAAAILEMLFIAISVPYIVSLLAAAGLNALMRVMYAGSLVGLVLGINAATTTLPLGEIRGLFRVQLHIAGYQNYVQETKLITRLGTANKLQNYNVIVLHYDPAGDRLYANAELAGWAGAVAPQITGSAQEGNSYQCSAQLSVLLGEPNSPLVQQQTKEQVINCAHNEALYHTPFYIVTDAASVPTIKADFGSVAKVVY